ncbi:MAG: putative Crp family transcriptional regulator [Chloroflexi bacterium OLB13]|nr:MAG: putative Crp family transcriptional regulator [Chloroflexi bacterium OLB13]
MIANTQARWSSVPAFAGLDDVSLRRIGAAGHPHAFQAGAEIFCEGTACAGLHIVTEGLVRIYRISPEGRMHTLSLLRPPATFNEVAAVDGASNPYNAVAVTASEVVIISHHALVELLAADSAFMARTLQWMARVNRDYIERLEDMTFRSIPSRLAKLYLHETTYADQIGESPSRLSQEEIAAILGTTREVVGRALRALLNAGLLKKRGRLCLSRIARGWRALPSRTSCQRRSLSVNGRRLQNRHRKVTLGRRPNAAGGRR